MTSRKRDPSPERLAPSPQDAAVTEGVWHPPAPGWEGVRIELRDPTGLLEAGGGGDGADLLDTARRFVEASLERLHARTDSGAASAKSPGFTAILEPGRVVAESDSPEAYRLDVGSRGVEIVAAEPIGLLRGATTLVQWLDLHPPDDRTVRGLKVRDWPDFHHRGLMLDISRNRVPTARELERTVDRMARLKLGQLQLYTEHTFAYAGHEKVWRGWSALDAGEIRRLDAYARARGVELVPNQNSFGHLHRWLVHEPYRRLAECPEGIDHPFSPEPEPFGLCPTDPGSLALLEDLFAQLLPNFRSRLFNLGLDETLDLGLCRSKAACEEKGAGRVYLDFLRRTCGIARRHGRRPLFWGDIILKSPELIAELPEDAIALEWGYEPDHPFAEDAARFAAAGRDFYVCPGTGAWSSFGGRLPEAFVNLERAAYHGHRRGALGYLITDWGDHGHLQPPPIGWPGWMVGACCAWNAPKSEPAETSFRNAGGRAGDVADRLAAHVLGAGEHRLAEPLLELGHVHAGTGARALNGSALFYALHLAHLPPDERRGEGMSPAHLEAVLGRLGELRRGSLGGSSLLARELRWVADMLDLAGRFARARLQAGLGKPVAHLPAGQRRDLLRRLDGAVEGLTPLWLARSRPGGLRASRRRLLALRSELGARIT